MIILKLVNEDMYKNFIYVSNLYTPTCKKYSKVNNIIANKFDVDDWCKKNFSIMDGKACFKLNRGDAYYPYYNKGFPL